MTQRKIVFFKNYFLDFIQSQTSITKKKISQTLIWISNIERLPVSIFKSIKGVKGLYEIRIEASGSIFRVFCCFDEGNLVVLFNGFQKKSQKTPTNEIEKAKRIMDEYYKYKENGKE